MILVAIVTGCGLTSCEKEDKNTNTTPATPSELIQGKWSLDKVISMEYEDDNLTEGDTSDQVMDLQFTGSDYYLIDGIGDTTDFGPYTISTDSLWLAGNDPISFELRDLTETNLAMFRIEEFNQGTVTYRNETTFYFEK